MKKIITVCLLGFMLLSLAFFTLFGEAMYTWGKPEVATARAMSYVGLDGVVVPQEALWSDASGSYVYLLLSEQGYSRVIYTVSRVDVEVIAVDSFQGKVTLASPSAVKGGDIVVQGATGTLEDGKRVTLAAR